MIRQLSHRDHLARQLAILARRKNRRLASKPKWVERILEEEGFRRSLAGFIFNSVQNHRFLFCRTVKRMVFRKDWVAGVPEHLSPDDFNELSDEEKPDWRTAFRLSLPDMALHSVVGEFLRQKLEGVLSDHCYAYRRGRGQPAAVKAVRKLQADQDKWVVKLDVERFNETADHAIMQASLAANVHPLLDDEERRVVSGTVEAFFELCREVKYDPGRGLLVGSGLTPHLTNLYLTPLDRYIENTRTPFVRYGDDLVAFCDTETQARDLLDKLCKQVEALKQSPNTSSSFNPGRCWQRGLRLLFGIDSEKDNTDSEEDVFFQQMEQRRLKEKTDIFQPGESFDFIGFEFAGDKVFIRQETLGKIKSRIEQYTQRGKRRIQAALDKRDESWGLIFTDDSEEQLAIASIKYVRHAIQRINLMLGFRSDSPPENRVQQEYKFIPGYGFPWNVLKCVRYQDVQEQFRILDAYAYKRLQTLAGGFEGIGAERPRNCDAFVFPGKVGHRNLRSMGLKTCKDVFNRFPNKQ